MIDLLLILYVSLFLLSLAAYRKEQRFLPLLAGSSCGLLRAILGYTIPAAAQFFSSTGLSALLVTGIVTIALESLISRDKKKMFFYLTFYMSVSLTALLAEVYGMLSGFWENADKSLFGLPLQGILIYYFFTFFAVLKLGELIYFFAFKKLFNELYVMDS